MEHLGIRQITTGDFEVFTSRDKLLALPEDTVFWPGHDYGDTPTSTIGREKEENIYITDFLP